MTKNLLAALCLNLFCVAPALAADSVVSTDYVSSLQEKAQQGDAVSEFNLGVLYHNGQGVPQDYAQAAAWMRKAAEQGDSDAELNLAVLYHDGQGLPQDFKQAAEWCQRAADQGNVHAEFYLSNLYKKGEGVPQSKQLAIGWLVRAVKSGGHLVTPHEIPHASKPAGTKFAILLSLGIAFVILTVCLGFTLFRRKKQ